MLFSRNSKEEISFKKKKKLAHIIKTFSLGNGTRVATDEAHVTFHFPYEKWVLAPWAFCGAKTEGGG